ncbi:unnamed protein product [Sympodiomycopsis kandeliae]
MSLSPWADGVEISFVTKQNGKDKRTYTAAFYCEIERQEVLKKLRGAKKALQNHLVTALAGRESCKQAELFEHFISAAGAKGIFLFGSDRSTRAHARLKEHFVLRLKVATTGVADDDYWVGIAGEDETYIPPGYAVSEFLQVDPRSCILSVAPSSRQQLHLPDISVSLAARPFDRAASGRLSNWDDPDGLSYYNIDEDRTGMQQAVCDAWPSKMLVHIVNEFAHKDASLQEVQAFMNRRVVGWPEPVKRLRLYSREDATTRSKYLVEMTRGRAGDKVTIKTSLRSTATKAINTGETVYREYQALYGRDYLETEEGFIKVREGWYDRFVVSEIEEHGLDQIGGIRLAWEVARESGKCGGRFCAHERHVCPSKVPSVHPFGAKIPCSQMHRFVCM